MLLRVIIDIMLRKHGNQTEFLDNAQQRMLGLRHGFFPTVGDAMQLFDKACSQMSRIKVLKCWIKSQ